MEKTAYEILNVSETATDDEIKKQYHTLMRNVHSGATSLRALTEEERQERKKLVREYNDAYKILHKKRASSVLKKQSNDPSKKELGVHTTTEESNGQKIVKQVLMNQPNELLKGIFQSAFSFRGSFTIDPNQRLRQTYWKLKSKKERLEKILRVAEQEVEIEFMKKSSTNEIQLNMEYGNLSSQIATFELNRSSDLAGAQQNYVFQASKRMIPQKKRDRLRKRLDQEKERINAKCNMMIEICKGKQDCNRIELEEYRRKLGEVVCSDQKVLKIKDEIMKIQAEMNSVEEQLGCRTQMPGDTGSYDDRSRVSV